MRIPARSEVRVERVEEGASEVMSRESEAEGGRDSLGCGLLGLQSASDSISASLRGSRRR